MKSKEHEPGKKRKIQQLVASTDTPNLGRTKGRKPRKRRSGKFNIENVSSNGNNKHSPRSRQTVLSEYFTSPTKSPKETPKCKPERSDEAIQKMVNVPLLMSQLLRARVVLRRIIPAGGANGTPPKSEEASPVTTSGGGTSVDPNDRVVRRYCYKCKSLKVDRQNISKRKLCRKCGALLIYVCVKCNEHHFIEHRHMRKHFLACRDYKQPNVDALASVVLRHCADCSFKSTHEVTMHNHIKHTGHKELDGEKVVEAARMEEDAAGVDDPKAKYTVKHNVDSSRKGIRRYCKKCKKIVPGSRTRNHSTCGTCNSRLIFRCSKCKFKSNFYKPMYYHVKIKCFPTIYRCSKCQYTAKFWQQFTTHLNTQKCSGRS